jgi:hypothetical protein
LSKCASGASKLVQYEFYIHENIATRFLYEMIQRQVHIIPRFTQISGLSIHCKLKRYRFKPVWYRITIQIKKQQVAHGSSR